MIKTKPEIINEKEKWQGRKDNVNACVYDVVDRNEKDASCEREFQTSNHES
jgi:hypothetical protein